MVETIHQTKTLLRTFALAILLGLVSLPAAARDAVTLAPRPGVTEIVYVSAAPAPRRSLILFTGGQGGYGRMSNNFVVRVAESFVSRGFTVAMPELPSDQPFGMSDGFRAGVDHAQDIAAIVALLRQRADVPVWLVGTSRGTICGQRRRTVRSTAGSRPGVDLDRVARRVAPGIAATNRSPDAAAAQP